MPFVSRAGEKLEHAFNTFPLSVRDLTVADFGSSTGGFVDCLLKHGAKKVYAVETGYGLLDWKLRNDPRVVVMERTNAMHVELPEQVPLISVDTSWTRLSNVLPNVLRNLAPEGQIVALLKPHYEAKPHQLRKGKLAPEFIEQVVEQVRQEIENMDLEIIDHTESPIVGEKGGNREFLFFLKKKSAPSPEADAHVPLR